MTYYNPVFKYGVKQFLTKAKSVGINGIIVPDLPVEEADDTERSQRREPQRHIPCFTVHKRRTPPKIVDASQGFLYLVSRFGVTGAQSRRRRYNCRIDKKGAASHRRQGSACCGLWHLQA
jgi:tryptophan synthase alpha chain